MKKLIIIPVFLTIIAPSTYCQGVYFKASSNYYISATTQQMPEYFTYKMSLPYSVSGTNIYYINLSVNEFSVASGLNFQGAVGYSLSDFFSLELKFSTFCNSKKEFEASPELNYTANGKTDWDLHFNSLLPTLLFGQSFNKSTVNVFVYSGFGFSKLNIKASLDEDYREYEFDRSNVFSWGYGLEYSYSISKNFSLYTNIGINNTNYKPDKAQLISSSYSMEYLTTSQKEIKYVNEISNLELSYDGSTDPNSPEIRLKETLKLNSIYWGVGIIYTLKK
jgi:Outer membrane protein beta-barrel domain